MLENLVGHRHETGRERSATAGPENRGCRERSVPNGEIVCRARAGGGITWGWLGYRWLDGYWTGRHLATEKALALNSIWLPSVKSMNHMQCEDEGYWAG